MFDKRRLQQVLLNLLTNATKFQNSGWILVTLQINQVDLYDPNKLKLSISVQDNGIGIAASEINNVFDLFWQSKDEKSKSLNNNGQGIGLYICKQICKGLGGDIQVHSEPSIGTTFVFTLEAQFEGPGR